MKHFFILVFFLSFLVGNAQKKGWTFLPNLKATNNNSTSVIQNIGLNLGVDYLALENAMFFKFGAHYNQHSASKDSPWRGWNVFSNYLIRNQNQKGVEFGGGVSYLFIYAGIRTVCLGSPLYTSWNVTPKIGVGLPPYIILSYGYNFTAVGNSGTGHVIGFSYNRPLFRRLKSDCSSCNDWK